MKKAGNNTEASPKTRHCVEKYSVLWVLSQKFFEQLSSGAILLNFAVQLVDVVDIDDLQSGDALYYHNSSTGAGHVMLFDYYNNSNATYILYECTTTSDYDRVAHTIRTASSVESTYTPIKYDYTDD